MTLLYCYFNENISRLFYFKSRLSKVVSNPIKNTGWLNTNLKNYRCGCNNNIRAIRVQRWALDTVQLFWLLILDVRWCFLWLLPGCHLFHCWSCQYGIQVQARFLPKKVQRRLTTNATDKKPQINTSVIVYVWIICF